VSASKKVRVFLTGGLGNQLFQLSAVIHFANSRTIEIDLVNLKPRKNSKGHTELLSLNLPKSIDFLEKKYGNLISKVIGYNLRSGYLPRRFEENFMFRMLRHSLSFLVLFFLLRIPFFVRVSRNLGNDIKFQTNDKNEILIGYFQTEIVAREVRNIKESLFHGVCEDLYQEYLLLSHEEKPLLVHVRLGDYLAEENFGLLSLGYYRESITQLWKSGMYKKIWLFSDQPDDAVVRIPEELRDKTRLVDSKNLESAETLRIMTVCKGFVIANSTFSWWAAYLRNDLDSPVFAPEPWFKGLPEPENLIPREWRRMDGFYLSPTTH
jgi:hypothetical protein